MRGGPSIVIDELVNKLDLLIREDRRLTTDRFCEFLRRTSNVNNISKWLRWLKDNGRSIIVLYEYFFILNAIVAHSV